MSNEESTPESAPSGGESQGTRRRRRKPRSGGKNNEQGGGENSQNNRGGGSGNNRNQGRGGRGGKNAQGGRRRRRGGRGQKKVAKIDLSTIDPERPIEEMSGYYDPGKDGNGFLRSILNYYLAEPDDPIIPASLAFEFRVRDGSMIVADVAMPNEHGQKPVVMKIKEINGKDPEEHKGEVPFKNSSHVTRKNATYWKQIVILTSPCESSTC